MSRIRSISIGVRLALAFGALCLACLAVGGAGLWSLGAVSDGNRTLSNAAQAQDHAGRITHAVDVTARDVIRHLYIYDGDLRKQDEIAGEIEKNTTAAGEDVAEVRHHAPSTAAALAKLETARKAFTGGVTEAVARSRAETVRNAEERDRSRDFYLQTVVPARDATDAAVAELVKAVGASVHD